MSYPKKIHDYTAPLACIIDFFNYIYLELILALSLFLRIPSLFEPNHYGDEGIYQAIGQAIRRGSVLYRDTWDNKPPFLYLIYALFDGQQFYVRLTSVIFGLLTILAFYFLAREIFSKSAKITLWVTLIFAILFSLPLLEGNIANAENFMMFPIILAFYLVFKRVLRANYWVFFFAGVLFSFAFLFKVVAIFDFSALLLFLMIGFWGKFKQQAKAILVLGLGFLLPIGIMTLTFIAQGALKDFLSAAFSNNVSYVASGNQLFIAQGWLILKLLALLLFSTALFFRRKYFEKGELLIFLWFGFSIFNAFFAGKPWIHYLLVLLPSFCLLLGLISQRKKLILGLILIIFTFSVGISSFWIYGKTIAYYTNFYSLVSGKKSLGDYRSFWGPQVNRDYRVAQFLSFRTGPSEPIFIWGNDAQIYALAKRPAASRYVVAYHMGFTPAAERETIRSLVSVKPRYFIILLPESPLRNIKMILSKDYYPVFGEDGFKVYAKRY